MLRVLHVFMEGQDTPRLVMETENYSEEEMFAYVSGFIAGIGTTSRYAVQHDVAIEDGVWFLRVALSDKWSD